MENRRNEIKRSYWQKENGKITDGYSNCLITVRENFKLTGRRKPQDLNIDAPTLRFEYREIMEGL
jgi:hypothetical protein